MKSAFFIVAFFCFLWSCKTTQKPSGVWVNKEKMAGKSYHKIFFVILTADIQARVALENELAAAAVKRGYEAVKSNEVIAFSLKDPKAPSKEEVVAKVKESGCDAVFVASLLRKEEAVKYTPGTTAYSVSPQYSWSGNYFGYYNYWYATVSTPGYYSNEQSYFMQSNLFDVASEEIMWSVKSELFDPSSFDKFVQGYVSTLISQLEKEHVLKETAKS